jgi:hypothetical protein
MDFYNEDYLKFNSLYISSDGRSAGIGTYSNSLGFMCGSVSVGLTTSTSAGASASFVYAPRTISMSGNTTYNPGTNSICYINKTNTSNLILTIATPSNDGIYLILRVISATSGTVTIQPSSTQTNILERGSSSSNATASVRLNGTSAPTSIKIVYYSKTWYEI